MWSDSYALAKTLECERNISSFSFYGQLADCCPHFFSLIHSVDEFSLKEMRTWGQSKISSCCICVWCKSREIGGRGSPRFPTLMVESFSPDLFPAVKVLDRVAIGIMYIASAKSQSMRRASFQPAFMDSCMTVGHMHFCPVYLNFYYEDSY